MHSKLTDVVYEYTNTYGSKLYDKASISGVPKKYYTITGSTNLNISRNATLSLIRCDLKALNISGLGFYYAKTYINTNCYTTTVVDNLLTTPAKPHYGGFISSAGAINRNSGTYTFAVSKLGTGSYQILYDYALPSSNYNVLCNPRISTTAFVTYSSQGASSMNIYIYTWSTGGTATDIGFSFVIIY